MLCAEVTLQRTADEVDFGAFFQRNLERARRLAWRLVGGDDAVAADVVQEAFFRAYRGLQRFRGEAQLDTWFYRILVNEAANYRRNSWVRRRRWGSESDQLSASACDSRATDGPPQADPALRDRIMRAMRGLSRGQREAFVFVHLENYTVREAAQVLGVGQGSVKKQLHRALVRLRQDLADLQE